MAQRLAPQANSGLQQADMHRLTEPGSGVRSGKHLCCILCRKRLPAAMAKGRVGKVPAADFADAPNFVRIKAEAQTMQAKLVAAKLQRATSRLKPRLGSGGVASILLGVIANLVPIRLLSDEFVERISGTKRRIQCIGSNRETFILRENFA